MPNTAPLAIFPREQGTGPSVQLSPSAWVGHPATTQMLMEALIQPKRIQINTISKYNMQTYCLLPGAK